MNTDLQEAINKLRAWQESDDPQRAHAEADGVLCDVLKQLGYDELIDEYLRITRWFA